MTKRFPRFPSKEICRRNSCPLAYAQRTLAMRGRYHCRKFNVLFRPVKVNLGLLQFNPGAGNQLF